MKATSKKIIRVLLLTSAVLLGYFSIKRVRYKDVSYMMLVIIV